MAHPYAFDCWSGHICNLADRTFAGLRASVFAIKTDLGRRYCGVRQSLGPHITFRRRIIFSKRVDANPLVLRAICREPNESPLKRFPNMTSRSKVLLRGSPSNQISAK
jgi:hypothetical protein